MLRRLLWSDPVLRLAEIADRRSENRMAELGMLAQAMEYVKINAIPGGYFEFGLWQGKTFRMARKMARRYGLDGMRFYGFDSFAGLPAPGENRYNVWHGGQFAFPRDRFEHMLAKEGFAAGEYELVEGFYVDSLTDRLKADYRARGITCAVAYIDCDLYESTRDVLAFLGDFLQDGAVVCFDDYYNYRGRPDMGEQRALAEYRPSRPDLVWTPYLAYSPLGMSFICHRTRARGRG